MKEIIDAIKVLFRYKETDEFIIDKNNNNKISRNKKGFTFKKAIDDLKTLDNCTNCTDCKNCKNCKDLTNVSYYINNKEIKKDDK